METSQSIFRLSDDCLNQIKRIKSDNNLKSMTAAIELCVSSYFSLLDISEQQKATNNKLDLIIKHINELRRNDYLVVALLDAMTMEMGVSSTQMHHVPQFRSPALKSAYENRSAFLAEVQTKIKENRETGSNESVNHERKELHDQ